MKRKIKLIKIKYEHELFLASIILIPTLMFLIPLTLIIIL